MHILSGFALPVMLAKHQPSLLSPQQLIARISPTLLPDSLHLSKRPKPGIPAQIPPSFKPQLETETRSIAGQTVTIHWSQRFQAAPKSPRIPVGYDTIKGQLPPGLSQTSSHILKQGNPLGTYTPFALNGKSYVALNEYHTHYAGRPHEPARQIYAITVFEKR